VLVQVTMDREDASTIAEFERALAAYQALRDEKLGALPGVQRLTSTIVMKRVVADRPYPT
jgi:DNA-binding Lrp family transcriptional regulator